MEPSNHGAIYFCFAPRSSSKLGCIKREYTSNKASFCCVTFLLLPTYFFPFLSFFLSFYLFLFLVDWIVFCFQEHMQALLSINNAQNALTTHTHTHSLVRGFNRGCACLLKVTGHISLFASEKYVFSCFDKLTN